jgi:hypothetical protein
MDKEDLILNQLTSLTDEVHSQRACLSEHTLAIIKLDTTVNNRIGYDNVLHQTLDRRLNLLEDFKEVTGEHNIAELQQKAEKKSNQLNDWRIWAIRGLYMALVGVITSSITGCIVYAITHH